MEARIITGPSYDAYHNNSNLFIWAAWNELIDNSIDNGATEISIENNGTTGTIKDNGSGIKSTVEDIERFLEFHSGNNKNDESKIGCYGVGFKEATMRLGKAVSIWTKAEGYDPISFDIPWYKLTTNDTVKWEKGADMGIDHGTIITIFYDEDDIKNNRRLSPDRTSFKYYDLIIKNKKINIWNDGSLYRPLADPLFDDKLKPDTYYNLCYGGKRFDIKIGILNKSYSSLSGFHVYSTETFRYYNSGDTYLDGTMSARDGIYVSIGIHDTKKDWRVDKNKRGVLGIDVVAKYLKDYNIIDKWTSAVYNSKKDETGKIVEDNLNQIFGTVDGVIGRERRPNKGDKLGTSPAKNTGVKRLEAAVVRETEDGYCKQRSGKVRGYKIKIAYIEDNTKFLSVNRSGSEVTVVLNRNNKSISQLLTNKNATALTIISFTAVQAEFAQGKECPYGLVHEIFKQNDGFERIEL